MNNVCVVQVNGYDRSDEIRRFVKSAFEMDAGISSFLENDDRSRLVVVKPNWVQEAHALKPDIWEPVITHPSVIIAVLETLAEKMRGEGTIAVCDAPHTYADFDAILERGGLKEGFR